MHSEISTNRNRNAISYDLHIGVSGNGTTLPWETP